jgi:hypothetical protein
MGGKANLISRRFASLVVVELLEITKSGRLYMIWKGMRNRCYNPNHNVYKYYGGKGVKVCDEWATYPPFRWWSLMNGYKDSLVINRLNLDGDYHPDNCEWVTAGENTRRMIAHYKRKAS